MRRITFIPVILGLSVICIVAMVRAQESPKSSSPGVSKFSQLRKLPATASGIFKKVSDEEEIPSKKTSSRRRPRGIFAPKAPPQASSAVKSDSKSGSLNSIFSSPKPNSKPQQISNGKKPTVLKPADEGFRSSPTRRGTLLEQRLRSIRQLKSRTASRTKPPQTEVKTPLSAEETPPSRFSGLPDQVPQKNSLDPKSINPADTTSVIPRRIPSTNPASTQAPSQLNTGALPAPGISETTPVRNKVLFSSSSPLLEVRTSGPKSIVLGKEASFRIELSNLGKIIAHDVRVNIQLPRWVEVVDSKASLGSARLSTSGNQNSDYLWILPQVTGGSQETLDLQIVSRENRPVKLGVQWTINPSPSYAQIEVKEPRIEMDLSGPQEMLYGETKKYTITLRNPGTGDAEDVEVSLLPFISGQEPFESEKVGILKVGETKTLDIELAAKQSGSLEIKAQATASGGLQADAIANVLVRRAQLEIGMNGPQRKFAGTTAKYQVRITNTGNAPAEGVIVQGTLPQDATYLSSSHEGSQETDQSKIAWNLGSLLPGEQKVIDLNCLLNKAGENQLNITAVAETDLSSVDSLLTHVEATADLKLIVNDPQGPVPVGEEMFYEIRIFNRGTKAAEKIDTVVFFSEGVEPIATEGGKAELLRGQVLFRSISKLNARKEVILKVIARADKPGNHVFRAEVQCDNPQTQLVGVETTRFYGDPKKTAKTASSYSPAGQPSVTPPRRIDP